MSSAISGCGLLYAVMFGMMFPEERILTQIEDTILVAKACSCKILKSAHSCGGKIFSACGFERATSS